MRFHVPVCLSAHTSDLTHLQEHCISHTLSLHLNKYKLGKPGTRAMPRFRCGTSPSRHPQERPDPTTPTASTPEPRHVYLIVGAMTDTECYDTAHESLLKTLAYQQGLYDWDGTCRSGYHYHTPSVVEKAKTFLVQNKRPTTIIFSNGCTRDGQHYLQLLGKDKQETLTEQVLQDLGRAASAAGKDRSCDVFIVSPEIVSAGVHDKVDWLPDGSTLGIMEPGEVGELGNVAKQLAERSGESDWSAHGISHVLCSVAVYPHTYPWLFISDGSLLEGDGLSQEDQSDLAHGKAPHTDTNSKTQDILESASSDYPPGTLQNDKDNQACGGSQQP